MFHVTQPCIECADGRCSSCSTLGSCITCGGLTAICPCWENSHRNADFEAHVAEALAVVSS